MKEAASSSSSSKKPRFRWSSEHHLKFVEAIGRIKKRKGTAGLANYGFRRNMDGSLLEGDEVQVGPNEILKEMRSMGETGLTRQQISSHLQKYRLDRIAKQDKSFKQQGRNFSPMTPVSSAAAAGPYSGAPCYLHHQYPQNLTGYRAVSELPANRFICIPGLGQQVAVDRLVLPVNPMTSRHVASPHPQNNSKLCTKRDNSSKQQGWSSDPSPVLSAAPFPCPCYLHQYSPGLGQQVVMGRSVLPVNPMTSRHVALPLQHNYSVPPCPCFSIPTLHHHGTHAANPMFLQSTTNICGYHNQQPVFPSPSHSVGGYDRQVMSNLSQPADSIGIRRHSASSCLFPEQAAEPLPDSHSIDPSNISSRNSDHHQSLDHHQVMSKLIQPADSMGIGHHSSSSCLLPEQAAEPLPDSSSSHSIDQSNISSSNSDHHQSLDHQDPTTFSVQYFEASSTISSDEQQQQLGGEDSVGIDLEGLDMSWPDILELLESD